MPMVVLVRAGSEEGYPIHPQVLFEPTFRKFSNVCGGSRADERIRAYKSAN